MNSTLDRTTVVPTVYEQMVSRGVSRRDFMKFCAWMSAYLGLEQSGVAAIAKAIETKRRLPVVWLHFQECTCCSESFLRSSHPIVADILLDKISLDYTETLLAASGHQAEQCLKDTMEKYKGEYLLCIEGSVPLAEDGVYCCIGGKTAKSIAEEVAESEAKRIVQEVAASAGLGLPEYRVTDVGPDHAKEFSAEVLLDGRVLGAGSGRSKKLAEQAAARGCEHQRGDVPAGQ